MVGNAREKTNDNHVINNNIKWNDSFVGVVLCDRVIIT